MSIGVSPMISVSRWQRADWVHNGLRALSLLGVLVALAILARRGEYQMLPIALIGLVLGPAIIIALFKGPERKYLLTLFFVGFALRTLAAVIAHPHLVTVTTDKSGNKTIWTGFLFEDDRAYHKVAWGLAKYWLGAEDGGVDKSDEYILRLYTYIVAWLYEYVYLARPAMLEVSSLKMIPQPEAGAILVMAPKLMNCFVGAIAVAPFYALGRELGGERAGRLVALASAFWPSLILWSIVNLKDIMVVVLIATIMYLAVRFARKPGLVTVVALLIAFAAMENMRLYVFYAFGWLVPLSFFLMNRAPWRRRLVTGIALWAAIIVVMLSMNQGTQWLGLRYLTDKRLEALDSSRIFGAGTAESGIDLPGRISRYEGGWSVQLRNIPIVLPYVLWSPFPWSGTRFRDLAVLPESLTWYVVQVLTIVTLLVYGRSRWRDFFLPVVYAGGLILVFSVIEGNIGTIFRHRVMLFPPAFTLAAMGALWVWSWWQRRTAQPEAVPASSKPVVASGGVS